MEIVVHPQVKRDLEALYEAERQRKEYFMGIHDIYIVDRTELQGFQAPGKIITPGANLYAHRWDNYHITDLAKREIMNDERLKSWFKTLLTRIENT